MMKRIKNINKDIEIKFANPFDISQDPIFKSPTILTIYSKYLSCKLAIEIHRYDRGG